MDNAELSMWQMTQEMEFASNFCVLTDHANTKEAAICAELVNTTFGQEYVVELPPMAGGPTRA